ncbi:MAG: hypothetical protein IPJ71_00155 [Bdellovibrionales bacterium]|nr:hypothetical protein [Bdellovibrionales bacterium]
MFPLSKQNILKEFEHSLLALRMQLSSFSVQDYYSHQLASCEIFSLELADLNPVRGGM